MQPGAARTAVAGLHGGRLKLRLAARAVEGAANAALTEFLAAQFGVPKRNVAIVSGAHARAKCVAVSGARRGPEVLFGAPSA